MIFADSKQADLFHRIRDLTQERNRLRAAIETVLADEESQTGGWGPDVTMVEVLKKALRGED